MYVEDSLETVAESLNSDLVVAGPKEPLEAVQPPPTSGDEPQVVSTEDVAEFDDAVQDAGAVVVALEGSQHTTDAVLSAVEDSEAFTVAVFDGRDPKSLDLSLLDTVSERVDATLLAYKMPKRDSAPETADTRDCNAPAEIAVGGAFDFARMVQDPGEINMDLADARMVLSGESLGVLSRGVATRDTEGADTAIERAFAGIPSSMDTARGSAALVSVVGGPEMSIRDAVVAVRTADEKIRGSDNLIWGVTIDDALANRISVHVVVDTVPYPLSAGDPCRRCGSPLSVYTLGGKTTVSCENCGFADLPTSLG
jgi:cell division protein FtsZ